MMVQLRKPNKKLLLTAIVMIVAGFAFLGVGIYQVHSSKSDETSNAPNFDPLLPKGKTIESFGGWEKLTSPTGDTFHIYVDTINGVTVNVSQQLLPGKFKSDINNKMLDVARAENANVKLNVDDIKVYIGTSAKGPQSVIFTKNGLLISIKSWATIPDAEWIAYIKSLG
jgi:hypothetical protein